MVVIFHTNDPLKIAELSCFLMMVTLLTWKKRSSKGESGYNGPCVFHMWRYFILLESSGGPLVGCKYDSFHVPRGIFFASINWLVGGIKAKSTKICQNRQMCFVEKPPCFSPFVQRACFLMWGPISPTDSFCCTLLLQLELTWISVPTINRESE